MASQIGQPVGAVGVIEPYARLRELNISPPRAQGATREWVLRYRPQELYTNLRPGLPCWLAWYAVQRDWPLSVVVADGQLEKAPSDIQSMLIELFHRADRTHTATDVFQRDALIRGLVPVVGIEDIMAMRLPNMGGAVIESTSSDRPESEIDYGSSGGDSPGDHDPESAG